MTAPQTPDSTRPAPPAEQPERRGQYTALALATVAFGINFWAWSLISPLAP